MRLIFAPLPIDSKVDFLYVSNKTLSYYLYSDGIELLSSMSPGQINDYKD